MRLFSYVISTDSGFSPNPFYGYCTLACCKPKIRSTAQKDDWVIGLSGIRDGNKIIYAMKVTEEPLTFKEYYNDPRFKNKIPDMTSKNPQRKNGDNIYKPIGENFQQSNSRHSQKDGKEDPYNKRHDLNGKHVLISKIYIYFGHKMKKLPKNLQFLIAKRGHRSKFNPKQIESFLSYIKHQSPGRIGFPSHNYKKHALEWSCIK
jgi:hypothetical protein